MQSDKFGVVFYRDTIPYAALGASFDSSLTAEYGAKTGAVLFCPDITRDPYSRVGLSEDGMAAAFLSRAWLRSRSQTVAYTEYDNAFIDDRAAREVWFRPLYERFSGVVVPASLNGERFCDSKLYAEVTAGKTVYSNFYDGGTTPPPPALPMAADTDELNARLAVASTVLLKNDGMLPVENAVYIGDVDAAIEGYLKVKRDSFSPRAMFRVARKLAGAKNVVVLLDSDGGLTRAQAELVRFAAKHAAVAVALLGTRAVEIPFLDSVQALLYAPAPDAARRIPDLATGRVSPAGRLPFTWAQAKDYPANNPKGNRKNFFYESVYTGYRYFGAAGITPAFAFGTGLNYLKTEYSGLKTSLTADALVVSFCVTNRAAARGSETAFIYLNGADDRAYGLGKRLIAFVKMPLNYDQPFTAGVKIPLSELAVYDADGPVLPGGKYGVTVENGAGARLYGVVKLGRKCKPRFTKEYVPSYFKGDNGLHILGVDIQKVMGVPLYGEQAAFEPDLKAVAKRYNAADDPDFYRKAQSLSPEQFAKL